MKKAPPDRRAIVLWLFDLDGTLVDTLPDLYTALVEVCRHHKRSPPAQERTREVASRGVRAMLELVWGEKADPALLSQLREEFIDSYRLHVADQSRPMAGIEELLEAITRRGRAWGIVTNKPASLTHPLVQALELPSRPCVVISGDSSPYPKPHPAPVMDALAQAHRKPHEAAFIGDAENDVRAGRAAGVLTLVALWGYLASGDEPGSWQADGLARTPADLENWLD